MPTQAQQVVAASAADETPTAPGRTLAEVLDVDRLSVAARTLVASLAQCPDLPLGLARQGVILRRQGQEADAAALARAAQRLAPDDYRVSVLSEWLNRRDGPPLWHFGMIHDHQRNETYARALRHYVQPGMIVFEIGAGTGILAMLAVQAGAAHVYTCELRADIAATARAIIERNGFGDRITVLHKDARDLRLGTDLPTRADLLVSEVIDDNLLGEFVLGLTEFARAHLLTPDAILLPSAVGSVGYLMTGRGHREDYRVDRVMGFDLSPFNRFAPTELCAERTGGLLDPLTEAVELARFDLHCDAPAEATHRVTLTANRAGLGECILRWLRLDFGADIRFENRPPQHSDWLPQINVLPRPRQFEPGDRLELEVYHNREWLYLWPVPEGGVR